MTQDDNQHSTAQQAEPSSEQTGAQDGQFDRRALGSNDRYQRGGIISWFAANPVAANMLMVAILVLGVMSAFTLRIEGFPLLPPSSISIDVSFDSGSAKQAEEGIAIKLENALKGLAGIKEITSSSTPDGVHLTLTRIAGYDLDQLKQEVKDRVDAVNNLPAGAERPAISKPLWEEHALYINLYGELEQSQLQKVASQFESQLLQQAAITKVIRSGWRRPEISIEVDEYKLEALGLSIAELGERIGSEIRSVSQATLKNAKRSITLKADHRVKHADDLKRTVVQVTPAGHVTYLEDIAKVSEGFEETPNVLSRFQGQPSISLQLIVDKSADIVAVSNAAKGLVEQWQSHQQLPPGMSMALWWDQSGFMLDRLNLMLKNGAIGMLLVMLVLALFLNIRVAFWVGMGLPICFAGSLILMGENFMALTLNDLTTFGFIIVLGLLVDDAVVVGESVYTARQAHGDTLAATIEGVRRVAVPTLFGVMTTIAAFYPLSFVVGEMGAIFSQFALIAVACLLFSMLESKLILPAHLSHLNTQKQRSAGLAGAFSSLQHKADQSLIFVRLRYYEPLLALVSRRRYAFLAAFFALFIAVMAMIPTGLVRVLFFPEIPRDIIEITFTAEPGQGYGVTHDLVDSLELAIEQLNQQSIDEHGAGAGFLKHLQSQVLDDVSGELILELHSADTRALSVKQIVAQIRASVAKPPGIKRLSLVTDFGNMTDLEINFLSANSDGLRRANDGLLAALVGMDGITEFESDLAAGRLQYGFELNALGRSKGLTRQSLAQQIHYAYQGFEVDRIQRGEDEVKILVRYPKQARQDVTKLQAMRVRSPSGDVLPLLTVANLTQNYVVSEINRVDNRNATSIVVGVDKSKISPDEVLSILQAEVLPRLQAEDASLQIKIDGESAEEALIMNSLMQVFLLSLLLIYTLLAIPLKSYLQPLIIMMAIPFGFVGAMLGHWVSGLAISILSIKGVLALSGVVVNDSLLLVSRFNELRALGQGVKAAALQAGRDRMRAVVLTSLTTFVGLYSLLQESSEQAAYLIPAAASLAYGILFATLITLLLIPVLLMLQYDIACLLTRNKRTQAHARVPVTEKTVQHDVG